MSYLGDFSTGKTVYAFFNTRGTTGAPITLSGGTISVYKAGSTTESTSGVTLTTDFDSRTGMHQVAVDTSADGSFYASGSEFKIVLTAGTADSVSLVGVVVGEFSLQNRSALRPTTADRTLDVSSGGEAGVDWANVGSPTTSLNLSGTTISTSQAVASVSGAVGSVTGGVTVSTNNDKTGYSLTQSFPTNFASLAITVGGAVTAGTVSDKTGYSLTQSFPANFASLAISGAGAVTVGTNNDKTGYALTQSFPSNFASLAIDASGHVVLQDASLVTAKLGNFVLAKTTNISGFNDIAASAIVSGGAITTSGGAVSTVSAVTGLTPATVHASLVKIQAATYDAASVSGDDITLSNGAVLTVTASGRTVA